MGWIDTLKIIWEKKTRLLEQPGLRLPDRLKITLSRVIQFDVERDFYFHTKDKKTMRKCEKPT